MIRAAAPEEANRGPRALITPLHANITVFLTSSSRGRQERKWWRNLGHLYFEEGANSATEINVLLNTGYGQNCMHVAIILSELYHMHGTTTICSVALILVCVLFCSAPDDRL